MNTESGTSIAVRDLVVRFGSTAIHDGLSLTLNRGDIMAVVGASGTGKSVLLKAIIGLIEPRQGSIELLGRNRRKTGGREALALKRRYGVLFQDGALFGSLTVSENIQVPMQEHVRLSRASRRELAALKLAMVGLSPDVGAKYPAELSGGMRKRAGLARALALDPELLFLDEPTAGLDPVGAAAFDDLLLELHAHLHLTVFMVTHDLDTIFTVSDTVAVLADKKLLISGPLAEVAAFDHPWIREYFHGQRARAAGH